MKDYSKLRPFDLEAARDRGELLTSFNDISQGNPVWRYTAGPDSEGKIIATVLDNGRFTYPSRTSAFRMVPLAWARKSADEDVLWPVYKGDVLYSSFFKSTFEVTGVDGDGQFKAEKYAHFATTYFESCTFIPPKVKLEGFAILRKKDLFSTKTAAEESLRQCALPENWIVSKVEWEE